MGHRCEAVLYAALEPDGPELAVCLACADGEPCVALRCAGQGRSGSSVQVVRDVWGDVQETGFVAPVIERTPEELGLPRVVPDVPEPEPVRPDFDAPRARTRSTISARRLARDKAETPERVIRGVRVRMPAEASMGGEMLDGFARELEARKGKTMGRGAWLTEETKRAIVEASDTRGVKDVAREFNVAMGTVSKLRAAAGRPHKPRGGSRAKVWNAAKAVQHAPRPVEIDPKRPGTASALLDALARQDARRDAGKVTIELTPEQLEEIVRGLGPQQVAAMVAAGLGAALATRERMCG
ncbi:MAG: hypothetical protein P4L40_21570 [Terracidiphilus sp.]|nr:hypothetical protein [Terracidiphilus sp.]